MKRSLEHLVSVPNFKIWVKISSLGPPLSTLKLTSEVGSDL